MGNTIYASFNDPSMAEKAAGALLDHGVKEEDLSIVSSHSDAKDLEPTRTDAPTNSDGDNDLKNAADAGYGYGAAAVDKVQEGADRTMGAISGSMGNTSKESQYEVAADRERMEAVENSRNAGDEWNDAIDRNRIDAAAGTYPTEGVIGSPTYSAAAATSLDTDYDTDRNTDSGDDVESAAKHGISTTTAEDAGAGAIKGAGWGLGAGAVAALASLFIPGFGLVLGGGALAAALGGVAAATGAGAVAGAVTGYLKDQGVDSHVAEQYEGVVKSGGAILAVTVPSGDCDREEAMQILEKYGAGNVNAYNARSTGGYMA